MLRSKFRSRILLSGALIAICAGNVLAQTSSSNESVRPMAGDRVAARRAKKGRHARPANTPRGATLRAMPAPGARALARDQGHGSNSQTRYPGDGPATFRVGDRKYAAQTEYSNAEHACVVSP